MVALIAAACFAAAQADFPVGALGIGTVATVDGRRLTIGVPKAKATVLFFITVDCPIANRYAPEISRITKEYSPKGFAFVRVYPENTISAAEVIQHGKDFSLRSMAAIIDSKHYLVNKIKPKVTPEAAVIGADGRLLYRGRIDDSYTDHGRFKQSPSRKDLREALRDVLMRRPVRLKNVPAVGCDIPDLD
jgi:hypothetical protein